MEKKINYLARDFQDIKAELLNFSKKYYPELTNNFNDSSVGSWFIDLVSAVGDDLNYHIDRVSQENNINSATQMSSVMNLARMNGIKIPGPKASMCEIELSCIVPVESVGKNSNEGNNAFPDWDYAPLVRRGSMVGSGNHVFELLEDVNFQEQFNYDGVSNRRFFPNRDSNGEIVSYTIAKTTVVSSGKSKVYKKVLTDADVYPFMEIILPEKNIMNVESIIFKNSSDFTSDPQTYEYFVNKETYRVGNQAIDTYRYFEVNSLSDQYRFLSETKNETTGDVFNTESYSDETEGGTGCTSSQRTSRYFRGSWKGIRNKFITEYTDKGYLKIIFGGSNGVDSMPNGQTVYANYVMSKIMNNDMLGVLPKIGWTMYVLYRTGGGVETNLAPGAINKVINANVVFLSGVSDNMARSNVIKSMKVTNLSPSIGGKDFPSVAEIKYLIKYGIPEQERCVTLKDYKTRIMMIDPKFGCPYRCNVIEESNKILIPMLYITSKRELDSSLPETIGENIKKYLSNYKVIGDYVELRSGRIYNLGFGVDIYADKNYSTSDVVKNVINTISSYMDIEKHDMGENIYISDLAKEISNVEGVTSIIDLRVYSLYDGNCGFKAPLTMTDGKYLNVDGGVKSSLIDLKSTDGVLVGDVYGMYELKNVEKNVQVRVKLK